MTQDLSDLKLGADERELLEIVAAVGPQLVGASRRAALSLLDAGLIAQAGQVHRGLRTVEVTPAGRSALQALGGSEHER